MARTVLVPGQIVNMLTAIGPSTNDGRRYFWLFKCACGAEKEIRPGEVLNGGIKSCGCLFRLAQKTNGHKNLKHGECLNNHAKSHLYDLWNSIKGRCKYQSNINWKHYGGRGIKVCDEWKDDFVKFRDWALANGYQHGLDIDRINNEMGYSPENCRFVTRTVNTNNTRRNVRVSAFGESKTIAEWSRDGRCLVRESAFYNRIRKGWPSEIALTLPAKPGKSLQGRERLRLE